MGQEKEDKEIEISLDFSKILNKELFNKVSKHKTAISLLLLLGIFYLSLFVRLATVDEPYLLAADPHTWYRRTSFIVEGDIPEKDPLRHWPEPKELNPGFFPQIAAYSFFLANALTGIEFYRFLFWFPAIVTALAVIPAFWIGRELYSNKAGLFAAFFIGMTPSILSRTMAGFFDTDCTNILLSLLTVALFLSAYNRIDTDNLRRPLPIVLSVLGGISLAAFALSWGGFAYIPWVLMGLFVFHWGYRILIAKGDTLKGKLRHSYSFFRGHLLVYIVLFAVFFLFTFPFQGFGPTEKIVGVTTFFQEAKAEGGIFPNVWVSISEEMGADLGQAMSRVGVPIFLFGFIGLAFLGYLFYKNFGRKSIYPETFFFMMIWILPTLYGSIWAVRFAMLLSIPLSICAGIGLGILFDYCINMVKKYGK